MLELSCTHNLYIVILLCQCIDTFKCCTILSLVYNIHIKYYLHYSTGSNHTYTGSFLMRYMIVGFTLGTTIGIIHFWGTKGSSPSTFKDRFTLIEQSVTLIEQSVTYRAKQYILRWLYLDKTQNLYHDAHKSWQTTLMPYLSLHLFFGTIMRPTIYIWMDKSVLCPRGTLTGIDI